ncbi:hypothetical protein ABIB25_005924 [Nakamurella sp. UYEF19]
MVTRPAQRSTIETVGGLLIALVSPPRARLEARYLSHVPPVRSTVRSVVGVLQGVVFNLLRLDGQQGFKALGHTLAPPTASTVSAQLRECEIVKIVPGSGDCGRRRVHRLRRVGETSDAAADVLDPSLATVREAVERLPPRGEMVLDDPSNPGARFFQVRRSPQDAEYWQVEVRLPGDGGHFVTRVTSTDQVCMVFAAWGVNSARLPLGPRWVPFDGSSVYAQRPYDLTVYLAGLSVTPLWDRQQWNRLVPLLAPVFAASDRGRTVVQSLQDDLSAQAHRAPLVKFGALSFNDRSHRKWTHEVATNRKFRSLEVSAPGSRASYRQGTPPDAFFRRPCCRWQCRGWLPILGDARAGRGPAATWRYGSGSRPDRSA